MPKEPVASRSRLWLALLTIYVIWGSTYLGIAVAIESVPPFLMAGVRFLIAGAVLLLWAWLTNGRRLAMPTRRQWLDAFIVGALLFGGGNGLVGFGEQTVPSGVAALLIALIAVWFAVFSRVFFGDRIPRIVAVGIAVGVAGVGLLVWPVGSSASFDAVGIAALIAAPICWASGSVYAARRAKLPAQPMVSTSAQMLTGGVVLLAEGLLTGEAARVTGDVSMASLLAIGYLIVFGSLVAFSAYAWLLRHAPLPLIGTYAFVNPVVAVALGAIFLAEPITPRMLLAAAVIVVGVALVILGRSRLRAVQQAAAPVAPLTRSQRAGRLGAAASDPGQRSRPAIPASDPG
jgi:drug/metabolite transporter (DMT)-like permease